MRHRQVSYHYTGTPLEKLDYYGLNDFELKFKVYLGSC